MSSRRKCLLVGAILSTCLLVSIQASQSDGGPDDEVAANEIVEAQISVGAGDGELDCGIGHPSTSIRPRIVGGVEAEPGEYPWMVSMKYPMKYPGSKQQHFCGGVIIHKRHILTARHCIISKNQTIEQFFSKKFYIGDYDQDNMDGEQSIDIEQVIFKNATPGANQDDIALLRTKQIMKFRLTANGLGSVNQICLPRGENFKYQYGRLVTVAGWGRTGTAEPSANKLREVDVSIGECHFKEYRDSRYKLCVERGPKAIHEGDSGGPLFARSLSGQFVLAGIVQGWSKHHSHMDDIYANVHGHLEWIDKYLE